MRILLCVLILFSILAIPAIAVTADEKNAKDEVALLREINAGLEAHIPQLKADNDELQARISDLQKENAALKEDSQKLKAGKSSGASKEDLERAEKENAALRSEAQELKGRNKALEDDNAKIMKQKAIVEEALKDQQTIITEEVTQMRKENEDLFRQVAELKKAAQK